MSIKIVHETTNIEEKCNVSPGRNLDSNLRHINHCSRHALQQLTLS